MSALTATLAAAWLTGCSNATESDADYAQVCQDAKTGKRVDDEECKENRGHGYHGRRWAYVPLLVGSRRVPAVGESVGREFSTTKPSKGKVRSASRSDGSYAKAGTSHGGFGGKHGGGS